MMTLRKPDVAMVFGTQKVKQHGWKSLCYMFVQDNLKKI